MPPAISVILPTLNEASFLPATLEALAEGAEPGRDYELIVVDGGSDDATCHIATEAAGATLIQSPKGRAAQLNRGAEAANGETLFFLHADTRVPASWFRLFERALSDTDIAGGGFLRDFYPHHPVLDRSVRCAEMRARLHGVFLGDQGIFTRREHFTALGGFALLPQCEDLDFSLRLRRCGRIAVLQPPALSAARRYEALGPCRTLMRDTRIGLSYLMGPHGRPHLAPLLLGLVGPGASRWGPPRLFSDP